MSKYQAINRFYKSLARIGTRFNSSNHRNRMNIDASDSHMVGVSILQNGEKKAMHMELIVPLVRSRRDSRRTARLSLNGVQARRLYETLSKFYNERTQKE